MSSVTAIILNYNGKRFLTSCIQSLERQTWQDLEIMLVDNGSSDGSAEYVRALYPKVRIIETGKNLGYAEGNDYGALAADSPLVLFVNNDVQLDPHAVERLYDAMQANRSTVACQPKILCMDAQKRFEYSGGSGGYLDLFGYPFCRGRIFDVLEEDRAQYDDPRRVFWAGGAAFMVRRRAFMELDGFDKDFFLGMEEIDFCWRARLSGREVRVVPQAVAYHLGGGTLARHSPLALYYSVRNGLSMLVKDCGLPWIALALSLRIPLDGLGLVRFALRGETMFASAMARGHLDFARSLRLTVRKRIAVQQRRVSGDREILRLVFPGSIAMAHFLLGRMAFEELHWSPDGRERTRVGGVG